MLSTSRKTLVVFTERRVNADSIVQPAYWLNYYAYFWFQLEQFQEALSGLNIYNLYGPCAPPSGLSTLEALTLKSADLSKTSVASNNFGWLLRNLPSNRRESMVIENTFSVYWIEVVTCVSVCTHILAYRPAPRTFRLALRGYSVASLPQVLRVALTFCSLGDDLVMYS